MMPRLSPMARSDDANTVSGISATSPTEAEETALLPPASPRPRARPRNPAKADASAVCAAGAPRRRSEPSMMSSCTSAPVWNTSTAHATSRARENRAAASESAPSAPPSAASDPLQQLIAASADVITSSARRRLPPALEAFACSCTASINGMLGARTPSGHSW